MDKVGLKKAVEKILGNSGFSRKSGAWYKSGSDAIVVIDLQKSDFGAYFYLNIGICIKELSEALFPKVEVCHISMRADALLNRDGQNLDLGLNMEQGTADDFEASLRLIEGELMPMISEFLSIDKLKIHYAIGIFKRALIFWQAREMLENPLR